MKNIKIYLLSLLLALTLPACNDSFLDRAPKDKLAGDAFWSDEETMKLYVNAMYNEYIWGHDQDPSRPPFGTRSGLVYTDSYSDNAICSRYNNITTWFTDKYTVPTSVSSTGATSGWYWYSMRRINYFLTNYEKASNTPETVRQRYAGEVLFFKAWDYYRRVQIYGDVPWYDTDLNTGSPELYKARDKREVVMGKVLECIDQAIAWLPEPSGSTPAVGRINKDMANHLKSRICLYEGTYRKYHTELGLESTAKTWLEECVKAAQAVVDSKQKYALYNNGDEDTYFKLFAFKGSEVTGVKEAILAKEYNSELGKTNDLTRYYFDNRHMGIAAQKSLVDEYLCADGRPIYSAGSPGSFTPNPLFEGFGKWTELNNRDPRMTQTIMRPGEYISVFDKTTNTYEPAKKGIEFPCLAISSAGNETSGYRFVKHFLPDGKTIDVSTGTQGAIEFRYAETLLNLIEAKAELADLGGAAVTQDDLDLTVNALRQRAGYDFATYPTAKLLVNDNFDDPRLDGIYQDKLGYKLPFLIREIRRERRVEMVLEAQRYWDLMRWKAGPLLTVPMRGILFNDELKSLYDGTHSTLATGVVNSDGYKEWAPKAVDGTSVFTDSEGFLILHAQSTGLPVVQTTPLITTGVAYWNDASSYYFPIPLSETVFPGTECKQTTGWEGK